MAKKTTLVVAETCIATAGTRSDDWHDRSLTAPSRDIGWGRNCDRENPYLNDLERKHGQFKKSREPGPVICKR